MKLKLFLVAVLLMYCLGSIGAQDKNSFQGWIPRRCQWPKNTGFECGSRSVKSWYYDYKSGDCKKFSYKGNFYYLFKYLVKCYLIFCARMWRKRE